MQKHENSSCVSCSISPWSLTSKESISSFFFTVTGVQQFFSRKGNEYMLVSLSRRTKGIEGPMVQLLQGICCLLPALDVDRKVPASGLHMPGKG